MNANPDPIDLFGKAERLLDKAIVAVPAIRYILAVAAIVAATSIIGALVLFNWRVAFVGGFVVFLAAIAVVIFAYLARHSPERFNVPALILTWLTTLLICAVAICLFLSVFFGAPLNLKRWLDPQDGPIGTPVRTDGNSQNSYMTPEASPTSANPAPEISPSRTATPYKSPTPVTTKTIEDADTSKLWPASKTLDGLRLRLEGVSAQNRKILSALNSARNDEKNPYEGGLYVHDLMSKFKLSAQDVSSRCESLQLMELIKIDGLTAMKCTLNTDVYQITKNGKLLEAMLRK